MVCMPFNPFSLPPSWNVYATPKKGHTRNRSLNKELGRIRQTPLYFGILVHLNILQFQKEIEMYSLFILKSISSLLVGCRELDPRVVWRALRATYPFLCFVS